MCSNINRLNLVKLDEDDHFKVPNSTEWIETISGNIDHELNLKETFQPSYETHPYVQKRLQNGSYYNTVPDSLAGIRSGLCVIANVDYYDVKEFCRPRSDYDVRSLKLLMSQKFQMEVDIWQDNDRIDENYPYYLTSDEFKVRLSSLLTSDRLKKVRLFALFVMCRGESDKLFFSDTQSAGQYVDLKRDICHEINKANMLAKIPKLIFVQTCRCPMSLSQRLPRSEVGFDGPSSSTVALPNFDSNSDMYIVRAVNDDSDQSEKRQANHQGTRPIQAFVMVAKRQAHYKSLSELVSTSNTLMARPGCCRIEKCDLNKELYLFCPPADV